MYEPHELIYRGYRDKLQCALLSVVWFPPHQRTTATAVATISMEAGHAMSFLLGPMMVKEPKIINGTL